MGTFCQGRGKFQFPRLDAVMALSVIVALAIGPPPEPSLGKDAVVDLSLFLKFDLGLKLIDFLGVIRGHLPNKTPPPLLVAGFHRELFPFYNSPYSKAVKGCKIEFQDGLGATGGCFFTRRLLQNPPSPKQFHAHLIQRIRAKAIQRAQTNMMTR